VLANELGDGKIGDIGGFLNLVMLELIGFEIFTRVLWVSAHLLLGKNDQKTN